MKRWLWGLVLTLVVLTLGPGAALADGKPPVTVPAGTSRGDVMVIGQDVTIAGQVEGSVTVVLGNLHLAPTARVRREVAIVGGTLTRDEGAQMGGELFLLQLGGELLPSLAMGIATYGLLAGLKLLWITATVAAALLWAFWPRRVAAEVREGPSFWRLLAVGALWSVVLALILGALCFTLWGIPLAVIMLLAMAVVSCLGLGMLSMRAGTWATEATGRRLAPWQTAALGVLLLIMPTGIPVLGAVALAIFCMAGLGQFVLALRGGRSVAG